MTQTGQITSADQALQTLASAPDFTGAGVKLVGIVADSQQGFVGYKIPLTREAQGDKVFNDIPALAASVERLI